MSVNSASSPDHLLAEVRRLERRLRDEVKEARQRDASTADERFRGLYISDDQIDDILNAADTSEDIGVQEDEGTGLPARLNGLARLFGLAPIEIDILVLCLLPDADLRYEKLYAYLQDDVTKKRPTVGTVLRLLCHASANTIEIRKLFHASAPLIKNELIRFAEDRLSQSQPMLARQLEIDERISACLLGIDQIDTRLLTFVRSIQPETPLDKAIISEDIRLRLAELAKHFKDGSVVLHLRGIQREEWKIVAEAVCYELGAPLLLVETGWLSDDSPIESLLPLVFREGKLQGAELYLDYDPVATAGKESGPLLQTLRQEIEAYPRWVILSGDQEWPAATLPRDKPFVSLDFNLPSHDVRREAWQVHGKGVRFAKDVEFADLAARYRLNVVQIRDAIVAARNLALWRSPDDPEIALEDINAACRKLSRPGLNTVARKIASSYQWQDLILPGDQVQHLREICSYVKYHETVYSDWGFGRKHSRGKGLNALFAGPSGTGKTMAAEIMAGELGFDLYKIDLSTIVSKYIGETEKNLDRIFREAQMSNAILFFDEADALFGKRSEVRDSHDRYANIEVAYLLQKMEDYDGVVILATNLRKNMDEAFARRMHFTIEFPMPEEQDRLRIWRGVFPGEAPLAKETDLRFMARQFKISGGNIKNVALNAAFLAAQEGGLITIEHLVRATKREYQKIGKLCTEGDFAQYFDLVKA